MTYVAGQPQVVLLAILAAFGWLSLILIITEPPEFAWLTHRLSNFYGFVLIVSGMFCNVILVVIFIVAIYTLSRGCF